MKIPTELEELLEKAAALKFEHDLEPIENYFVKLATKIQKVANSRQDGKLTLSYPSTKTI
jgi:hypothetical protein